MVFSRLQEDELYCSEQSSTWAFIFDKVRFQVEHDVGDYYFITERSSTIAMAAVVTAFTQVNDEEYKIQIMKAFACVEKHHDFEEAHVLFEASARLSMLTMEDDEVPFHHNSKLVFKPKALLNVLGCTAQVEYDKTHWSWRSNDRATTIQLEKHSSHECYFSWFWNCRSQWSAKSLHNNFSS